ncbi:NRAMP family divalent metal transporter [Streptacidiphilus sp. MAP12-16]|uniref:NRAMP family divalent metal transporter n=1 Tax=Streptacidiphilus sp. MAP12-16 TaxID=3156300 RepID=UPI003513B8CE
MLADTDAGSLVTAAQSGAQWGYRMILPQVVLIPVLYVVQEITLRLGIVTGQPHGALIRARFGRWWATLSVGLLFISVIGALLTEFAAVAGVGECFGIPPWATVPLSTAFLLAITLTGSHRHVERIAVAVGMAELALLVVMLMSHPRIGPLVQGLGSMPLGNCSYLTLVAANVGTAIMPWLVHYQQSAVIDKKLSTAAIREARQETAVGAVLTQSITVAMVITVAATVGMHRPGSPLDSVGQIADALTPYLGHTVGTVLLGLGMTGAALVAAIVSSTAGAWGLAEAFGRKPTLAERTNRRPATFYLAYALAPIVAAVLVLTGPDLIGLSVGVGVLNTMLLPIVLGLLLALEAKALPKQWRMRGPRKHLTRALCLLVSSFGVYTTLAALGRI